MCVYNNPARPRRAAKAPPKAGTLTAEAAPVSNVEAAEEAAEPVAEDWEPVAEAAEPVDETWAEVLTAVAAEAEEADLRGAAALQYWVTWFCTGGLSLESGQLL